MLKNADTARRPHNHLFQPSVSRAPTKRPFGTQRQDKRSRASKLHVDELTAGAGRVLPRGGVRAARYKNLIFENTLPQRELIGLKEQ